MTDDNMRARADQSVATHSDPRALDSDTTSRAPAAAPGGGGGTLYGAGDGAYLVVLANGIAGTAPADVGRPRWVV